jgi:hypothetical protein
MVEVILALCCLVFIVFWFGEDFFITLLNGFYNHRREMKELDQDFERERLGGVGDLFTDD